MTSDAAIRAITRRGLGISLAAVLGLAAVYVLALGYTSYERFCQTGKDFDKRLEELGGTRLVPRVDCDVDYDEAAAACHLRGMKE